MDLTLSTLLALARLTVQSPREGARAVADKMGVDFREVRKVMVDVWRQHRGARATVLDAAAIDCDLSDQERAQDF